MSVLLKILLSICNIPVLCFMLVVLIAHSNEYDPHTYFFSSNNHSLSQAKQKFPTAQYIIWSFGCSEVSHYVVEGFSLP